MEHSTIFEALIGGLVSGTIAAGFIWILFRPGKLEWLWLLPTVRKWVFRNLGGDFHARGLITRRLSSSNPARP